MRLHCTLVALSVASLGAVPAVAQDHPNHRRGTEIPTAYDFGELDSINLFNGNLTLAIPIGLSYPVNGGLQFQLGLHYNSTAWEFEQGPFDGQGQPTVTATPNPHSNVGLGWSLILGGKLWAPNTPPYNDSPNTWLLVEADGSRRSFAERLHPGDTSESTTDGVLYTTDSSYLRSKPVGIDREVESPDGTIRRFNASGNLTEIRDRFNNRITVNYSGNPWTITTIVGGTTRTLNLTVQTMAGLPRPQITQVKLESFGGVDVFYNFEYYLDGGSQPIVIPRHASHSSQGLPGGVDGTTQMPLLKKVTLPDGSAFEMAYYTANEGQFDPQGEFVVNQSGMLRSVTLPTLGKYEWQYGVYAFQGLGKPLERWFESNEGVLYRTISSPVPGTSGGTWKYKQSGRPFGAAPPEPQRETRTWVLDPLGFTSVHYFRNEEGSWWHGLPFTSQWTDGQGHFLSKQVFNGVPSQSTLARSEYVTYTSDPFSGISISRENQRLEFHKTVLDDDGGVFAAVTYSNFDGLGHYRQEVLSGNFGAGDSRTMFTNFNPLRRTYPGDFTMLPVGDEKWVLNTFTYRELTEGAATARTETCFEAATGFQGWQRTYRVGVAPQATDVLVRYGRDAAGNQTRDDYFGGDQGGLGATAQSDSCNLAGLPANQYQIDHGYQAGQLSSSQYIPSSFKSLDRVIDPFTGLASASRDTAQLATSFAYDTLGRLTWEMPEVGHDGWTEYAYARATLPSTPAKVTIRRRGNGSQTAPVLAESVIEFDGLGRVYQEKQKMPDGSTSTLQTLHNAMGWRTYVSELGAVGSGTSFLNYDPFGRPTRIRPSDGSAHDVVLSYTGARIVNRTIKVATGAGGAENSAITTERYDRQGRLWQVTEPSGAGGANVTTTYTYNVLGLLSRVSTTGSGTTQNRWFNYDNRGFLTSEQHPEKGGPAGNGTVVYQDYDARGHARRRIDGPNDLQFVYDRAERIDLIWQTGTGRNLKDLVYGTGNSNADRSNGKVKTAARYNYPVLGGTTHTVILNDTYTYGGRAGRVSNRQTALSFNGTTNEYWNQGQTYDPLGNVASLTYPDCAFAACPSSPRTVSHTYGNGRLTVVGGYASAIFYHPSGAVHQVNHGASNQVVDTYGVDPNGMGRPSSIAGSQPSTQWGSNGDIPVPGDYDGDGDADHAVWRPANGTWYVRNVATVQWGLPGDIPVPADYDGDGRTDFAVWRPSGGHWYARTLAGSWLFYEEQWGYGQDRPVPADYDGDGRADLGVWRPSDGTWWARRWTGQHIFLYQQWGYPADTPVPADYDGDGLPDLAVWRPSDGTWWARRWTGQYILLGQQFGLNGDTPLSADYDGNGAVDLGLWRPADGTWHARTLAGAVIWQATPLGVNGDRPVPAHYDQDDIADLMVWRPSNATWYPLGLWTTGTFAYDGAGNVKRTGNSAYIYDSVSRLTSGTLYPGPHDNGSPKTQSYTYDAFGNIQSVTTNGATVNTPTSSSLNRLSGVASYDTAGSLTYWNGQSYEYDALGQMKRFCSSTPCPGAAGEEWLYMYNADEERVWSFKVGANPRFDRYALRGLDGKVLREYANPNYSWSLKTDYIYRDGQLIAAETPSGQRHFHLDHLGTPRAITDATGNRVAFHTYYPFGEEATSINQDSERMKFTGHERDLGNLAGGGDDLDYMHARHHSPITARFLSTDPANAAAQAQPQTWNRYSYSRNNPITRLDPDGRTDNTFLEDYRRLGYYDNASRGPVTAEERRIALFALGPLMFVMAAPIVVEAAPAGLAYPMLVNSALSGTVGAFSNPERPDEGALIGASTGLLTARIRGGAFLGPVKAMGASLVSQLALNDEVDASKVAAAALAAGVANNLAAYYATVGKELSPVERVVLHRFMAALAQIAQTSLSRSKTPVSCPAGSQASTGGCIAITDMNHVP